jgi:molybdopterin adenylyltransferase
VILDMRGVRRDCHRGDWHRQVSLLSEERIASFSRQAGTTIGYGEFAENITTRGIPLERARVFDRFKIGRALLEVTQIGKECHGGDCEIFRRIGKCLMPEEGIFAIVKKSARIRPGDAIEHVPRSLRISVLTLSDRASTGVYADESGPVIRKALEGHLARIGWDYDFRNRVIPDDKRILRREMRRALSCGSDIIITTGGTGLTRRDVTPQAIRPMLDLEIPGIMEWIRIKHAGDFPNAVLSRSIAGIIGNALVYVLPGSPRAAKEYMEEIAKTLEHCILMVKDNSKNDHR